MIGFLVFSCILFGFVSFIIYKIRDTKIYGVYNESKPIEECYVTIIDQDISLHPYCYDESNPFYLYKLYFQEVRSKEVIELALKTKEFMELCRKCHIGDYGKLKYQEKKFISFEIAATKDDFDIFDI